MATSPKGKKPTAPNKAFVRKDPDAWKSSGWTSGPNSLIRDEDTPPEEIWAWMWLASHTTTFEISGEALWNANNHIGRDKAYKLLARLEGRGLLIRTHEVDQTGIPYIVYDLQPAPVAPEQRTAKPSKAKPRKSAFTQDTTDSYTSRNPAVTRENTGATAEPAEASGFLHVQESGSDQGKHSDPDADSSGGVSTERAGESARPGTTVLNTASESGMSSTNKPGGVSPERAGESYREEKTKGKDQPTNGATDEPSGAAVGQSRNAGWLADEPDQDGVRTLRSLPHGIGDALSSKAVAEWSHVVAAALRSGLDERAVVDKLTADLPDGDRNKRVKIVAGHRLPDLKTRVDEHDQAQQQPSPADVAQAKVDRMAGIGAPGARQAAGLLGEHWEPEQYRGDAGASEWLQDLLPRISREFVEARREALISVLTSRSAA